MTDQYWTCKQHKHHVDRINSALNKHLIQAMYNLQLNVYLSQCKSFTIKLQCNLPHRNFCSIWNSTIPFLFVIQILMILIDFTQRRQQQQQCRRKNKPYLFQPPNKLIESHPKYV